MNQRHVVLRRSRRFTPATLAALAIATVVEWDCRRFSGSILLCLVGFLSLPSDVVRADETNSKSLELFEKHVRPALVEHCIRCHGPDKQQGGLRLDTRDGWVEGGDSGAAATPGDLDSLLLQAIGYKDVALEMPPRGKLSDKTIAAFLIGSKPVPPIRGL